MFKKILVIEDQRNALDSLLDTIFYMTKNCEIRGVTTLVSAQKVMQKWNPDIVFLDPGLPQSSSLQYEDRLFALHFLKEELANSIYAVITAYYTEDEAEIFRMHGACGYFSKLGLSALDIKFIIDNGAESGFLTSVSKMDYDIISYRCEFLSKTYNLLLNKIRQFSPGTPFKIRCEKTAEQMGISYETVLKYFKDICKILQKYDGDLAKELRELRKQKHRKH